MLQEIQELVLHSPCLKHDFFYVEKRSKEYQTWDYTLMLDGDIGHEVEVFVENRNEWMKGKLDSWYIEDGSGNAPAANRHYFFKFEIEGKKYKLDLYDGLKVRMLAPTDEALKKVDWCEGCDFEYVGPYNPDKYIPCSEHGTRYVTQHGQAVWFCDKHVPEWIKQKV